MTNNNKYFYYTECDYKEGEDCPCGEGVYELIESGIDGSCYCHQIAPCSYCENKYILCCTACEDDGVTIKKKILYPPKDTNAELRYKMEQDRIDELQRNRREYLKQEQENPTKVIFQDKTTEHNWCSGWGTCPNGTTKEDIIKAGLPNDAPSMLVLNLNETSFNFSYCID